MIYDITHAITSLRPGATWIIHSEDYNTLEWFEENTTSKPTLEEIEQEIVRLQAEYDGKEYQRLRSAEYPSFADQFDLLYHGGYDAWKAQIQAVKDKYPKP
jgi:hypothetical protein